MVRRSRRGMSWPSIYQRRFTEMGENAGFTAATNRRAATSSGDLVLM